MFAERQWTIASRTSSWIPKTDFTLCRVNVYIDCARIEIEKRNVTGYCPFMSAV